MRSLPSLLVALTISNSSSIVAAELVPLGIQSEAIQTDNSTQKPACSFPNLNPPTDFSVFAAGAYSGRKISFQIDQSGHEGTQIDVTVNSPKKPVALILGTYEPTIWNIKWSTGTKILAVLVSGYHRQAVAGLEKNIPLINSSRDNGGPCGYFSVTDEYLPILNPLARHFFGQPVETVYPAREGLVVVGEPLQSGTRLITSYETPPESFYDKEAPMAGLAGLEDAVRKGLLRKATPADIDAWAAAVIQNTPQQDVQPVAGDYISKRRRPAIDNAYVVLKPFTYPAGLYGAHSATFIIPKGIPRPVGKPGHSKVYDFNTLKCQGALCSDR